MSDILIDRFERYFRHPDWNHEVLRLGDHSVACLNVRRAIYMLGIRVDQHPPDELIFDTALEAAVVRFQDEFHHRVSDGAVGTGTRQLIISNLLAQFNANIFLRLDRSAFVPSVFLSYAWRDSPKVDKLDQWLRDRGVRVIRDTTDFVAGTTIPDNILRNIAQADKVVAVYSANSYDRDWPRFERAVAEDIERKIGTPVLIYLCLDNAPLPVHDTSRLAIMADRITLREIGLQILHALQGTGLELIHHKYDEYEPL